MNDFNIILAFYKNELAEANEQKILARSQVEANVQEIERLKKENEEVQSSVFSLISKIDKAMIDDNISDKLNANNNITDLDIKKIKENIENIENNYTTENTIIEDKEAELEELKSNIIEESIVNEVSDNTKSDNIKADDIKEEYNNNIQKNYSNVANVKVNEDEDPFSSAYDASWDSDIEDNNDKTETLIEEEYKEVSHQQDDNNNDSYDFDVNEEDQYMFGDDDEEDFFFDDDSK